MGVGLKAVPVVFENGDTWLMEQEGRMTEQDTKLSEWDLIPEEQDSKLMEQDLITGEQVGFLMERDWILMEQGAILTDWDAILMEKDACLTIFGLKVWKFYAKSSFNQRGRIRKSVVQLVFVRWRTWNGKPDFLPVLHGFGAVTK